MYISHEYQNYENLELQNSHMDKLYRNSKYKISYLTFLARIYPANANLSKSQTRVSKEYKQGMIRL